MPHELKRVGSYQNAQSPVHMNPLKLYNVINMENLHCFMDFFYKYGRETHDIMWKIVFLLSALITYSTTVEDFEKVRNVRK